MKVLIINSPLFKGKQKNVDEDFLPPIGLGYIASYLQKENIPVDLIDSVALNLTLKSLRSHISKNQPDFVAINIFSTNYSLVKELIESIRIDTHIVIGGLSTKSIFQNILEWKTKNQIDIVIGDGELVFADIVKGEIKEKPFYEKSKRRVFNISSKSIYFVEDISSITLNRNFFENEPLINISGIPEMNLITSRGCIYNCSFCAAARSLNKDFSVRERSDASIIEELTNIKKEYPETGSIRILDDLFLKNSNSLLKAIDIFSRFDFQWRSMAHIKTFNNTKHEVLIKLKESGCNELFIGVESGSPSILKSINKTNDLNLIIANFKKIFQAHINIKAYFIYGFPNETIKDMEMTYNLVCKLKEISNNYGATFRPSVFQFRPYHGTQIHTSLKKNHPNLDIGKIYQNKKLTALIGRGQFNFRSNNYSKVSLKIIGEYICKTNMV